MDRSWGVEEGWEGEVVGWVGGEVGVLKGQKNKTAVGRCSGESGLRVEGAEGYRAGVRGTHYNAS